MFRFDKGSLVPLGVSKRPEFVFVHDPLLLSVGERQHYVLIKELSRLVCNVKGTLYGSRNMLCRNCFHVCISLNTMRSHQAICLQNRAAVITMPGKSSSYVGFKQVIALFKLPFFNYFDLESLIIPVQYEITPIVPLQPQWNGMRPVVYI